MTGKQHVTACLKSKNAQLYYRSCEYHISGNQDPKICHFRAFRHLVPSTASGRYEWSIHSRVSRSS